MGTVKLIYCGQPLPLVDAPPSAEEIMSEGDRIHSSGKDGQCELQLRFRQ
jgi:hypothetical protein